MSQYCVSMLSQRDTWCTAGLCDHQHGQDVVGQDVHIRTYMFLSNWTPFIKQLKLASANQLGREGLSRDNTIAFSGQKQVIPEMLEVGNGDMRGERANRLKSPFS